MSKDYSDIIHLKRPVSEKHKPMSKMDRAAQFAPFAALTGYDGKIKEASRETDKMSELSEDEIMEINAKLQFLKGIIQQCPLIQVEYFKADEKKEGGRYFIKTGNLMKIDEEEKYMMLDDRQKIDFDSIYSIDSEIFNVFM